MIPFDLDLRRRLATNLARLEVRRHRLAGRRRASVALVVIDSDAVLHGRDTSDIGRPDLLADLGGVGLSGRVDGTAGGAALLLTRRGRDLARHAGQWALPGGRVDPGETALQAAIREAAEEVGVTLDPSDLLGRLDDYPTRSGWVITPFVFWAPPGAEPRAEPGEVSSIHRISLRELCRPDSPRFVSIPESERPVVQVPVGGDLIHAPTGAVLYQFRAVAVDGDPVRVDELEQPVFAWR